MKRIMKMGTAAAMMAISLPAYGARAATIDLQAVPALPFTFKVVKIETDKAHGKVFTIATVRVKNGDHYIKEVDVSCEARNKGGYTWQLAGRVMALNPNEEKEGRIVAVVGSDPNGYWTKPNVVRCEVNAFDADPWSVEFPDAD